MSTNSEEKNKLKEEYFALRPREVGWVVKIMIGIMIFSLAMEALFGKSLEALERAGTSSSIIFASYLMVISLSLLSAFLLYQGVSFYRKFFIVISIAGLAFSGFGLYSLYKEGDFISLASSITSNVANVGIIYLLFLPHVKYWYEIKKEKLNPKVQKPQPEQV